VVAVLVTQELEGITQEIYDGVNARLGADSDPPAGLILHASGPTERGWRIVDVWDSEDDYRRFAEDRIGPAVMAYAQDAGIEPVAPDATVLELYDLMKL
jgi:hypothetical protein